MSDKSAEKVKDFLKANNYDINDFLTYGKFLDLIIKITGSSKIPYVLSRKAKRTYTVNDRISFFDYLPFMCINPECDAAKGQNPKIFYLTPIELLENLIVNNGVWCPRCISRALEERRRENNEIAIENALDEEVELNTELNKHDIQAKIERGRGKSIIVKQDRNVSFVETTSNFGGNIKQKMEDVEKTATGEFVAKHDSNTVTPEDAETIVIDVSENSNLEKHDTSNEDFMKELNDEFTDEERMKELKKRYMINELNRDNESDTNVQQNKNIDDDVEIRTSSEIPDDLPRVIDPRVVKRRPLKR